MSLAVEKSTMCFSYVYIETIVVYKVCRRPVKQFRVITSTCAPIRSCRLCKNKKKKREEEEKRNYMPCKDILEPWPNIGWFIRRLLSRRRRTRSQGDPLNALLSQDVTQGHKSDVFWIACSEMLRGTKRATCYRLVSWRSQIKNLAFNALKILHTDGIENYIYNICCLTVKAEISGKIRMIREKVSDDNCVASRLRILLLSMWYCDDLETFCAFFITYSCSWHLEVWR